MQIRRIVFPLMALLGGLVVVGCGGGGETGESGNLPACPTAGTDLTYDNFGKAFFDTYCLSCHSTGAKVDGAGPYETQAQIQASAEDIYGRAGGTNTNMPQSGAKPTSAEREQLAEWLSCGAE